MVSKLSKRYVRVPVSASKLGLPEDLSDNVVEFAFTTGSVDPTVWRTGDWETVVENGATTYYARVLIGPGSTVGALTAGTYKVWVKITDSPEVPVIRIEERLQVF
jgi:hypothetical protein